MAFPLECPNNFETDCSAGSGSDQPVFPVGHLYRSLVILSDGGKLDIVFALSKFLFFFFNYLYSIFREFFILGLTS